MTDNKIARLNESIRLTLTDAQERCDRNETLPLECGRAVVKVARIAFDLCHEQASDLAALRERLAAAEALSESRRVTLLAKSEELAAEWRRAETAEALVRELAAVVKEDRPRSYTEHANGMACGYPDSCWACRHDAALAGLSAAARKEIEG